MKHLPEGPRETRKKRGFVEDPRAGNRVEIIALSLLLSDAVLERLRVVLSAHHSQIVHAREKAEVLSLVGPKSPLVVEVNRVHFKRKVAIHLPARTFEQHRAREDLGGWRYIHQTVQFVLEHQHEAHWVRQNVRGVLRVADVDIFDVLVFPGVQNFELE